MTMRTHRFTTALLTVLLSALAAATLNAETRVVSNAADAVNWSAGVSYTYDGAGNISQIGNDKFVYDETGRLVQATVNGVQRNYEYDAFGNRTKCRQPEGDCQYGMTIRKQDNRVQGVGYDGTGNVTRLNNDSYAYDEFNMVTTHRTGNVQTQEYIYTADDERLATYTVGSSWTWTVREASDKVLREFTSSDGPDGPGTGSWNWSRDYVWRDGQLLASRHLADADNVATDHYHLDHLGTPRRVTDDRDNTAGFHDYYAFGPEVPGGLNEPFATNLKYTGHERDSSINGGPATLDYMHARYYSSVLGKFLSVDPRADSARVSLPQSWNRYTYALNNPFKLFDPDGEKWTLHTAIGFSTKTRPVEIDPKSVSGYNEYLDYYLGERIEKGPVVMGKKAPAAFEKGLKDPNGITVFIGHGFTNTVGILFTDAATTNTLQNVTNKNPVVCLAGCGSAAFAKSLGITPETKGRAFVGFAGNVHAAFLARISAQFVQYLNDGLSVGDAVTKLRAEYQTQTFRIVLIGDPNVKAPPCAQPTTPGTDRAGHPTPPPC